MDACFFILFFEGEITLKIANEILDILAECRIEDNIIYLPEQLERKTYEAVNTCLTNIGGKWNRKSKGHVFDYDPTDPLENLILTGETEDMKKAFQFFPTPRPVSNILCDLAELDAESDVLEPSIGRGDLADVILERGPKQLYGVELNPDNSRYLTQKPYDSLIGVDFLTFAQNMMKTKRTWNRVIMNPPFSRQQDIEHIYKAFDILSDGGILVAVVSLSPFFRTNRKSVDFRDWLDAHNAEILELDEGMFKESGTSIRVNVIKIRKNHIQNLYDSNLTSEVQNISDGRNSSVMTHSNVFYILGEKGFQAEKNAIPVPNKAGLDLFRIGFNISDGKTGRRIAPHDTESQMLETVKRIENDTEYKNRIESAIDKVFSQTENISPRYSRPDEKYEDLFPAKSGGIKKSKSATSKAADRQEEKAKYETAVSNAEKAIYGKQSVVNTEIGGTPAILCLFRENNITIPRTTKDWVVSSLCGVHYDEKHHMWAFRHNGSLDAMFRGFFDQLVIALTRKHGGIQLKGVTN